jgi:type IV pilus assembly protein PilF
MNKTLVSMLTVLVLSLLLQACAATGSRGRPSRETAAQANLNLGVAYLRQGNTEQAMKSLKRALDENPRLADAHSAIALAYEQLGDVKQAEEHYKRATQLEPKDGSAQNSYAVFLCRHGHWEEAEPHFKRAADSPNYSTPEAALTNAGICARNAGDLAKAENYFRQALDRDAKFPEALASLMDLAYRQKHYLQARAFMQRSFDVSTPSAKQLWLCFRIEQALKDDAGAQRCATQLQSEFPNSPEVAQLRELEQDAGR